MKAKYNTWIKLKKTMVFVILFLVFMIAAALIQNLAVRLILAAAAIVFGYISLILLISYYYFSERGRNYQALVHGKIADKIPEAATLLLDIGAGSGALSIRIAKMNKNFAVKAVDY